MNKHKDFSIVSQGLRYKLKISFYLMSILPLLVCIYLVSNYILPNIGLQLDITLSLLISIFVAVIGFFVIKGVFDRVVSVTTDAKLIAAGDINFKIDKIQEDEIGDLGYALNQISQRIRSNMEELKSYSEKTTLINIAIQKRFIVLSSLLEISSLISQGAKLEEIFSLATEKSQLLANSDATYLLFRDEGKETFYMKAVLGLKIDEPLKIRVGPGEIFDRVIKTNSPFILDKENVLPEDARTAFYDKFRLNNSLALPIYSRGRIVGILGIGNTRESFSYEKEDIELLDIFSKQISIAVENDELLHRIEKLEIKDALTGLYNEVFIRSRLQEEIRRAIVYQRPCGFILLNIDDFKKFHQYFGSLQAEAALKKIATLVQDSVTEIERVGRFGDNEFAIVLPEKNKRRAQEVAEEIRKKIEFCFSTEQDVNKKITVSGGVAENPLDGINAEELIIKAKELVKFAKLQGKNRIIAFMEKSACQ